jgi:hypothetical protein
MTTPLKLWTTALRSDEYKQTTGCLSRYQKFCCLGVACELYRLEFKIGFWETDSNENTSFYLNSRKLSGNLPSEVKNWLGISPQCSVPGLYNRLNQKVYLSGLNDEDLLSFSKIADVIDYFWSDAK